MDISILTTDQQELVSYIFDYFEEGRLYSKDLHPNSSEGSYRDLDDTLDTLSDAIASFINEKKKK